MVSGIRAIKTQTGSGGGGNCLFASYQYSIYKPVINQYLIKKTLITKPIYVITLALTIY
jgi:hypothetical protein